MTLILLCIPAPCKVFQPDWLPFFKHEIMYTDGVKTNGFIVGSPRNFVFHNDMSGRICTHTFFLGPFSGYIAVNSAGEKGCE